MFWTNKTHICAFHSGSNRHNLMILIILMILILINTHHLSSFPNRLRKRESSWVAPPPPPPHLVTFHQPFRPGPMLYNWETSHLTSFELSLDNHERRLLLFTTTLTTTITRAAAATTLQSFWPLPSTREQEQQLKQTSEILQSVPIPMGGANSSSQPPPDGVEEDAPTPPRKNFRSLARYVGFLGSRRPVSASRITPDEEEEVIIFRFSKDHKTRATVNDKEEENGKCEWQRTTKWYMGMTENKRMV